MLIKWLSAIAGLGHINWENIST